jgi:hypothetical protein
MHVVLRAIAALVLGAIFYGAVLFSVFRFTFPLAITRVLIWNISLFSFWGRGQPVGYMPNGEPVYDGSLTYGGYSLASISTGFVIYPILIFILFTALLSIRKKRNR